MTAPLVFDRVRKSFGTLDVLDGASFAAEAGRCTTIEGPTGSGKSLLLRLAMQRVAPDAGMVRWFGQAIPPLTPALRMRIACTGPGFQLDRLATVAEALLGEGAFRGLHGPDLRGRFHELLEQCDLKSVEDRVLRGLTAADQAVAHVAGAVIGDPAAILLDDPIALAPQAFDRIEPMLRIAMERGTTVVVFAADASPWRSLNPTRFTLHDGRIAPATATTAATKTASPSRRAA